MWSSCSKLTDMGGGVSGLKAVSGWSGVSGLPGPALNSQVTSLDRSALTWALVNGPPHLAAWQLIVLSAVISRSRFCSVQKSLSTGAASNVTVLYLEPQSLDAALNLLSHHHSVTPTFGHGSVTFSSNHPMPTQLKGLDNIYLFHWYAVCKVSRDVYLNATQLDCIIVVRRVQVGFEKESNDPIKTTRKEGGSH